ncbi:MAG: glycoside hydrolase family 2 TIM barrel-domain containing protein [Chitinivibrionales bacterium]
MRNFRICSISAFSLLVFFFAALSFASMTERLEGRFLKSRIKMRIDEGWKVQSGTVTGAQATAYNDTAWTTTNVPHDFAITLVKPTGTAGNDPAVRGWYRKHFTVPAGWAGKKVIVQFDGVYHDSKIYLNGDSIGAQQYGYTNFYCDLTPKLNATGDNVLAVMVDDQTVRNSRWYSGCGIFRHVWLIATDKVYVKDWGTDVTTPVAAATQSQIVVKTYVVNDLTTAQTRTVSTTIYDEGGNALQTASTPITVSASGTDTCVQTLTLSSCQLWSLSTPVRYYAYTQLLNGTSPADDYISPFGIRELKFTPGTGMTLNGVPTKMKGICMHENLVPVGSAIPDEMFERAIRELKASGCTSIRTSHNQESQEFYDICDQVGMMVLNEWCDKWYQQAGGAAGMVYENWDQTWRPDLERMVERDRNHPCVVMWSVGNEVYYGATIPTYITSNMSLLVPWVHTFDSTSRPVLNACNVIDAAGYVNLAPIQNNFAGINYGESIYAQIHSLNPNVLIQGTESSGYLTGTPSMPTYSWVKNNAFVVGHHLWTGVDYLGEGGNLGATSGFLDGCIFRKSWFYYQQTQWSDSPMVHVTIGTGTSSSANLAENWNQTAGSSLGVVTYTNCDSVSLYVNETKIGTEKLSSFANMIMQWTNVPWSSGTIKAIGMKGGAQAAVDSIVTVGAAAKVFLKPSKTTLYADGEDVCCIEADIADANNNLVYSATNPISFTCAGAGRSLGIASGDWTSAESFKAASRAAYHGKVLIVIQSTPTPGTINVTVNSGTLTPATLAITTVAQSTTPVVQGAYSMNALRDRASLFTCAQNPGSKTIRVSYRVDVPGAVSLSVVSPSGRTVSYLTNRYHQAGAYSADWNARSRNGVYFFVLKTGNTSAVRKAFMVQ